MRTSILVGSAMVAAMAGAIATAACSSSSNNGASSSDVDASTQNDAATPTDDAAVDAGPPYLPAGYSLVPFLSASSTTHTFAKADQVLDPSKSYVVVLETTAGRIVWQLSPEHAPIACNSFIFLTLNHYFDGIAFHRVIDAFVAQGGDPNTISKGQNTWGTGGPGYAFDNEDTDAGLLTDGGPDYSTIPNFDDDAGGVVAMANTGQPNSNGSQFFITFGAQSFLDGGYTIFGNVIEGMDVLPKIIRGEPKPSAQQPGYPTRITEAHIGQK